MRRDLKTHLQALRKSGEIKTGRELKCALENRVEADLFPGQGFEADTLFGRCYMRELTFPLSYRHGNSALSGLLNISGPELALPARDQKISTFTPAGSLFFDLETTGLAGGTGTLAFLIGLGWLEGDYFVLRQYFLRQPAEERSLLSHFSSAAEGFQSFVTFNGKIFDLPLIRTRQLLSGLQQTEPALHLDLYQCAKTLWKNRLLSRSLRSIEENLLGLSRHQDILGAEIPAVYFDYLRFGKTARLKQVFQHNVLDILSMVTLLEKISCLGSGEKIEHPAEALALGRLFLAAGKTEKGVDLLSAAASEKGVLAQKAALELAFYYKRQGAWLKATELWKELRSSPQSSLLALVELAKYYEHRLKNLNQALEATEEALLITKKSPNPPLTGETSPAALEHRLRHLKRRLQQA